MINKDEINDLFTFPQLSLDSIDISNDILNSKSEILRVQKNSDNIGNCHLSFYPLAKNIRFVSSYFYKNIKNNKKSIISSERPSESEYWFQKTRDSWYPWMWSRYFNNNSTNKESWENIFLPIEDNVTIDKEYNKSDLNDFFLYLSCIDHIFRINSEFENSISHIICNLTNEKICGLQIRRGEIVSKNGNVSSCRPIYSIEDYVMGLRKVCESLSTNKVFLSTDSYEVVDHIVDKYPEFNFIVNNYDRDLFLRYDGKVDIPSLEIDLQSRPDLIKHYTESCIADLISLSMCDGYVGGMKYSEFGVCGWFLQMARKSKITPYFNVEGDFDMKNGPLKMLLL